MHFPNPIRTSGPSLFCFLWLVVLGGDTLGFVPPVVGAGAAARADCAEGASVAEGAGAGAGAGVGAGDGDGAAVFAGGGMASLLFAVAVEEHLGQYILSSSPVSPQIA